MVTYPILIGEMAKRGIKKQSMANTLGISTRALYNKLSGKVPFTWPEVCVIQTQFFSDIDKDSLFCRLDEHGT